MHSDPPHEGAQGRPTGRVALLFTDVAGSTRGWEEHRDAYDAAIRRHFEIISGAVAERSGHVFKTVGDAVCAVFAETGEALNAAIKAQRRLRDEPWPDPPGPIRVRMAVHAGEPVCREGDYFGPPVNRVARLLNAAHPDQILLSAAVHEALSYGTAPSDLSMRPLGVHLLKDLQNPEALFQAMAPGLPSDFPPPRTLDARPHNLPVQLTTFVGRGDEIMELAERLETPATRLVTLMGPPGVGKTRLATQFAGEYAFRYPDGVWLVELAPVRDPDAVAQQIEAALGLTRDDGLPSAERLQRALAERRLLLVCDNFEHVLPAADVIAGLLRATKDVQVLVTSRSLLRIQGETVMEVAPLAAPSEAAPVGLAELSGCPATALFMDRAAAARPGWEPTGTEAAAVADLCRDLDGLPLAIELAAARMRSMTLKDIRARLSDRFRLLSAGSVDLPERQRTLRAAMDWSFGLLSPEEQGTLAQLGVFRGGFTLEAAEAVVDAGDVWDMVPSLHDHSFLVTRERAGEMRYDMLEAVREYACERLAKDLPRQQTAHAAYFLPVAEGAATALDTTEDAVACDRMEADIDNIRAAMAWACDAGEAETCARFAAATAEFLHRMGLWAERLERLERALTAGRAILGDRSVVAWLLYHHANALADLGRLDAAEESARESLRRARALGDARLEAWDLNLLGFLAERRHETEQAETFYRQTVEVARAHGDAFSLASALTNRGRLADFQGQTALAESCYGQSIPLWRKVGSARGLATTLANLGCIADEVKGRAADEAGQPDAAHALRTKAIALFEEALDLQVRLKNLPKIALLLNNIGEALTRDGRPAEALPLYVAAERMFRQAGSAKADYVAEQKERAAALLAADAASALCEAAARRDPLEVALERAGRGATT